MGYCFCLLRGGGVTVMVGQRGKAKPPLSAVKL